MVSREYMSLQKSDALFLFPAPYKSLPLLTFPEIKKGCRPLANILFALSDPDKIRTCNLLIRSQMRYPVAPQGLLLPQ